MADGLEDEIARRAGLVGDAGGVDAGLAVTAEEKFGAKIPDEEVKNLKTVGDAVTFIKANQAA